MRIAMVWNAPHRLREISVRYDLYLAGFRKLGHEAFAVSTKEAAVGFGETIVTVDSPAVFKRGDFWKSLNVDVVVIITWHRMVAELAAMREAGIFIVSLGDSDGQDSVHVYPFVNLHRMLLMQPSFNLKLRAIKYWAEVYLRTARKYDEEAIQSTRFSDKVVLCHLTSKQAFGIFLNSYREGGLVDKIALVPYPVDDVFLTARISKKDNQVVAIGRWDDPRKGGTLLDSSLKCFLRKWSATRFLIVGPGSQKRFSSLRATKQVEVLGYRTSPEIFEILSKSRSLIVPSWWEGAPIVASEALCVGCSLIGPPTPFIKSFCYEPRFGSMARSRNARALAHAIHQEMEAWSAGDRRSSDIASIWRPQFDGMKICSELLRGFKTSIRKLG